MFNLFKKKEDNKNNNDILSKIASLLIHAAKIDENYTEKEKNIIEKTLISLGIEEKNIVKIMIKAEENESNSNQILNFTREIKNLNEEDKKKIVESLWNIIYSDSQSDMYEANLMRRLSGLLYLDNKIVGDIKERIKSKIIK
tara:strand:- start:327 stop:752 length:426 start_codon:yes stop_codon:yes gene_type:complete